MGLSISAEEEYNTIINIYNHQKQSDHLPDVAIDLSLLTYSGLNSTTVLQSYSSSIAEHLKEHSIQYTRDLVTATGGLTSIPNAVGLGALVISILIETVVASYRAPTQRHKDLLERVFAEQKTSELRDLIDEYLKRYEMYLHDNEMLLKDTQAMERQVSTQLTRVRNSILKDGQMNNRVFKQWVNGAAFHTLMLIQLARLEQKGSISISKTISAYERDLEQLLKSYKALKVSNIFFNDYFLSPKCKSNRRRRENPAMMVKCYFCDREFGGVGVTKYYCSDWRDNTQFINDYVNYVISNHKDFRDMKNYFCQTKNNLDSLIAQRNSIFTISQ